MRISGLRDFNGRADIRRLLFGRLRSECRQNVLPNAPCVPGKFFNYGLDVRGGTLVCDKVGVWTATGPLIGIYNVAMPCPTVGTSAQGSDGVAFACSTIGGGTWLCWAHRTDTLE